MVVYHYARSTLHELTMNSCVVYPTCNYSGCCGYAHLLIGVLRCTPSLTCQHYPGLGQTCLTHAAYLDVAYNTGENVLTGGDLHSPV